MKAKQKLLFTSFMVLVLLASFVLAASANTPVSGAAFTTVNETVDGTDHCKNGDPTRTATSMTASSMSG